MPASARFHGVDFALMSEHTADSTGQEQEASHRVDASGLAEAGSAIAAAEGSVPMHAGPRALPAAPEIAGDLEAMILSIGRAIPPIKLAVALGMITPEAAEEAAAQALPAPDAAGMEPRTDADGEPQGADAAAVATPAKPRRKAKSKSGAPQAVAIIEKAIEILNDQYEKTGRAFRIERVAGGYRFMTLARYASAVASLHQDRESVKLSRPSIETLAIIAYRQPITRAELEAIRGVACGEVLRSLMERRLIAIVGRSEELGRPMLYGTTRHFLDAFGLATLKDLPSAQDLKTAL